MPLTTRTLHGLSANNACILQFTTIRILVFSLAILFSSISTGCSSSGDSEGISVAPSSGGSNGAGGSSNGASQTAVAGPASASLAWDSVPDVLGYIVHYGTTTPGVPGSCAYAQSTFTSSPSATVTGLAANTTYYFAVSAFNGLESACSAEVSTLTSSA